MTTLTSDPSLDHPKKKLKRVRKPRPLDNPSALPSASQSPFSFPYFALLLLRFLLLFLTTATLEGTEFSDAVDPIAVSLLPHLNTAQLQQPILQLPEGMGVANATRSVVGAMITSGLPYMAVNLLSRAFPSFITPSNIGYIAVIAPRIFMFLLSILGDLILIRCYAVYQSENVRSGLITYASLWTTLLASTRNMNFSLESMCVSALIAACFGWPPNTPRPLFCLSAFALALGVFLRPPFAFFICTPIIYLSSLWGKQGIDPLRYARACIEGAAIFAFMCTVFVCVDSFYYGTFKLLWTGARGAITHIENFDMFIDHLFLAGKFSYKGFLVYSPLNALWTVANRKFLSTLALNTSPGQMFLSLPAILGPLFIVLIREGYEGLKVAMKELMSELKQAANSKQKKRKPKKAGMTKEQEDELYVYFDTIQTTFLLGLLIEVVQNHNRLGVLSLISLMPACVLCISGTVFGPDSSVRFRYVHVAFTVGMILFYGFLNQSGITRVMLQSGAGGIDVIPQNAHLVMYKGIIGHRSMLGANVKNISIHDGGESRLKLMTTLRELKAQDGYGEDRLLVCAPGTVEMKAGEFERLHTLAYGHMSTLEMPNNIDDAIKKSSLVMYKFVGDEDEAIIRDDEEAAEREEREGEEREREKQRKEEL